MKLTPARLDALIWGLIYGGLFAIALGLALRAGDPTLTGPWVLAGSALVAAGIVFIFVRARSRSRERAASRGAPGAAPRSPAPPSKGAS